jgi:signal transduction histidine kinase
VKLSELKSGFLGMAAHDLRNPNVLVKLYLNQLVEEGTNEKQRVWINKIQSISSSMMTLIDDFLDISIIEAGQLKLKLEPVLPDVFFMKCFETNRLLTKEKSITLKLDLEKGLPMVNIDSDKINQVINNLITNALKYSVSNAEIILSMRVIDEEAVVSVIDQGQGIPKNDINKLFKMFGKANVRPTADEKSTGLGLVICKHIVGEHGGRIWVESEGTGKGATFKFTLPLK